MKKSLIVRLVIGLIYGLFGYAVANNQLNIANSYWVTKIAYVASFLIVGYSVIVYAFDSLIHLEIFADSFLILGASIGVILLGNFVEALIVLFLFVLGEGLRDLSIAILTERVKKVKVSKKSNDERANILLEEMPEYTEFGKTMNIDLEEKTLAEKSAKKVMLTFTIIFCFLAVFIAFIPPIIFNENHREWIYRALMFVAAATSATAIASVPITLLIGRGSCFKNGILVKKADNIYNLAKTKIAVLDKTATITTGLYEINKIVPKDISEEELIRIVAHGEKNSQHVLAIPLRNVYRGKYDETKVKDCEEIPGKGIKANIFLDDVLIGNEKLLREYNIRFKEPVDKGTIVHVAVSGEYKGYFVLSDMLREDAKDGIEVMAKERIKDFYLISGDNRDTVVETAGRIGISDCYSELLPGEKEGVLEGILSKRKGKQKLLFVGMGENNKACLEKADIGAIISDTNDNNKYLEYADCVITEGKVSGLGKAINISKKTIGNIKESIYCAIIIKIAILTVAGLGYAKMWMIPLADLVVSLLLIFDSMKLLKK